MKLLKQVFFVIVFICTIFFMVQSAHAAKALGDIPGRTRVQTVLTEDDMGYIATAVALLIAQVECKATPVENGLTKLADRNGIDVDPLNRAIFAAIKASAELPYERGDLITDVTKIVSMTFKEVKATIATNKPAACSKWTDLLRNLGVAK